MSIKYLDILINCNNDQRGDLSPSNSNQFAQSSVFNAKFVITDITFNTTTKNLNVYIYLYIKLMNKMREYTKHRIIAHSIERMRMRLKT